MPSPAPAPATCEKHRGSTLGARSAPPPDAEHKPRRTMYDDPYIDNALLYAEGIEFKTLILIPRLSNAVNNFDPWKHSQPLTDPQFAARLGCKPQYLQQQQVQQRLFGPEGMIERTSVPDAIHAGLLPRGAGPRNAYIYRVRRERIDDWIRTRAAEKAKEAAEAKQVARARVQRTKARKAGEPATWSPSEPVAVSPEQPLILPKPARPLWAAVERIQTTREVVFSTFILDGKGTLTLDFALPAPLPSKTPNRNYSFISRDASVENKALTTQLRDRLNRALVGKGKPCAKVIDDEMFGRILDGWPARKQPGLAPLTPCRVDAMVAMAEHSDERRSRKITGWALLPYLVASAIDRAQFDEQLAAEQPAEQSAEARQARRTRLLEVEERYHELCRAKVAEHLASMPALSRRALNEEKRREVRRQWGHLPAATQDELVQRAVERAIVERLAVPSLEEFAEQQEVAAV
jgi:hypothetical protein